MPIQDSFCTILLMRRTDALPEHRFVGLLPKEASERAMSFLNPKRQADFLWSRLLLLNALREIDAKARLYERAPLSPRIESKSPLFCSISHTRTFLGIALSDEPVAIDLEILDARRPLESIFRRCFAPLSWERIPESDRVRVFYDLWGMHECAVKLPGRIDLSGENPMVRGECGQEVRTLHRVLTDETLLTCVGGGSATPEIKTLELGTLVGILERLR